MRFRRGPWVAERDAGGGVEDAANGPGGFIGRAFSREKDFADALLLGPIVPASEEREMVGEGGKVGGGGGLLFERGDEVGGAEFRAEGLIRGNREQGTGNR